MSTFVEQLKQYLEGNLNAYIRKKLKKKKIKKSTTSD